MPDTIQILRRDSPDLLCFPGCDFSSGGKFLHAALARALLGVDQEVKARVNVGTSKMDLNGGSVFSLVDLEIQMCEDFVGHDWCALDGLKL